MDTVEVDVLSLILKYLTDKGFDQSAEVIVKEVKGELLFLLLIPPHLLAAIGFILFSSSLIVPRTIKQTALSSNPPTGNGKPD